ncbi:MAG: hypothetical protein IJ347_04950 [Faecalibacterium sp.]|nr:hypothetical protein [Faecalibacterium sp.]
MADIEREHNLNLLQAVAANAEMGKNALEQLTPMAEDPLLKAELLRQKNFYREIDQQAHTSIAACGEKTKGQGMMAKAGAQMGITMKTMGDKSTRTLAKMVLEGSQQGVVDCVENLRDCPKATPGAKKLAQRLQDFEQDCVQRMQSFL